MNKAYLLLGGNLGDRSQNLQRALAITDEHVGPTTNKSDVFVTKAWGNERQPDFYNQAVCIETGLSAVDLLHTLLKIEELLGRKRTNDKWQARTIDIDILFFNDEIIDTKDLKIPHPFLQDRKFVLMPMMQIASNLVHPLFKKTIRQLSDECKDTLEVEILNAEYGH